VSYLGDVSIDGDVQSLSQIGSVTGNVFIVNDALAQPANVVDETPRISIVVTSRRFGRKVRLRVSKDIAVGIFTEVMIDALRLPRSYRVEELELDLVFKYAIAFAGHAVAPNIAISGAGMTDGAEVELLINLGWEDPITGKKSKESRGGGGGRIKYRK
jgi:hypothetical protein